MVFFVHNYLLIHCFAWIALFYWRCVADTGHERCARLMMFTHAVQHNATELLFAKYSGELRNTSFSNCT